MTMPISQVNFATSDVCAATANIALVVNAFVANYLFGEPFKKCPAWTGSFCTWLLHWDLGAIMYNIGGAVLVVASAPRLDESKLPNKVGEVANLMNGNTRFIIAMTGTGAFMVLAVLGATR